MLHAFVRDRRFYPFLLAIDRDLAQRARERGCAACGGVLHVADYPRVPRGIVGGRTAAKALRLSFCCATEGCRRRVTPGSVRFLGRKVYFGVIVLLASVIFHGVTPGRLSRLGELGVLSHCTVARWCRWWRQEFAQSSFWTATRGLFAAPIKTEDLPVSLVERFESDERARVVATLRFLVPIAGGKGLTVHTF